MADNFTYLIYSELVSKLGGLKYLERNHTSRCGTMTRVPSIIRDDRGGPLVEESLLLGLAVITISIVIAVILQATGWAQDVITGLLQLLQNSWNGLTNLLP
jgi:hypothetical protein